MQVLSFVLVAAAVAVLCTVVRAQTPPVTPGEVCTDPTGDASHCICDTPDGQGVVDVTSLGNTDGTARYRNLVGVNNDIFKYDFNPCYGFSIQGTTCTDTVACQESTSSDENFECGAINSGKFFYDNGKSYLQYSNGEGNRVTQVNLICDKTIEGEPEVIAYGDSSSRFLIYDFEMKHKCACPGMCGGGGGGGVGPGIVGIVFMLLAIFGVIAYVVIGIIINIVKFQKKGIDAIPNKAFWIDFPFLLKDGVMFVFGPIIAAIRERAGGGGSKGSYNQL